MKLMLDQSNNFCVIFKVEFSHYLFTGLFMDIIKRSSMLINFWDLKGWEVPTFWTTWPICHCCWVIISVYDIYVCQGSCWWCTSSFVSQSLKIRNILEEETQMELKEYRSFIDEEMITILGQMDSASKIFDHVYLVSKYQILISFGDWWKWRYLSP